MNNEPAGTNAGAIAAISPPWLLGPNNGTYMRNMGNALDTLKDKVLQGVRARMPGRGTLTALPYIGLDRLMPRAPTESDDSYIERLRTSFATWQQAGGRPTVLHQVDVYVGTRILRPVNQTPMLVAVGNSQGQDIASWDWYYSTNDTKKMPQRALIMPTNWNWDNTFPWWRTWLIIFSVPGSTIGPEATWGNGTWGEAGGSWGLNIEPSFGDGLRATVRQWKSANTFYPWIVMSFNPGSGGAAGSKYSPNSTAGNGNPDGTWGRWGKLVGGVWSPSRPDDDRFLDGTGIYQDATVPTGT